MAILGERGLSGIVKYLLDLILLGGMGIYISLPFSVKWYLEGFYATSRKSYFFLLVFLYLTGLLCFIILLETRKIFKTLNRRNPFQLDNVKSLKRIAISCFLITFCYIVKIFVYNSFLTIIIAMVFLIAGLFSIVFSEVFRQAVEVKEENDLTI